MNYWLPAIALSDGILRLPLADSTAKSLVGWVLASPLSGGSDLPELREVEAAGADETEALRAFSLGLFSRDPAFLLWCVSVAEELRFGMPLTVRQIGNWFFRQPPSLLMPLEKRAVSQNDGAGLSWQNLARAGVNAAWSGGDPSRENEEPLDSPSFLERLLHNAPVWFASTGSTTSALPASVTAMLRGAVVVDEPERVRQVGYDDAPSAWDRSATHDAPWGMLLERALWQRVKFERLQDRFAEELEQSKLAAMKELAYGAGHEINNPLANIGTRAQALLRQERDPERRRQLITINKQVFRAHAMIADMMLFAKPPSLNYERIDVGQLLERLLRELEDELRDRDIRLQGVATPGLVLEGDANQLMVALRAICQNSVDALHHGGAIWVRAELLVSDREPGGDEEAGEDEAGEDEAGREEIVFEVSDDGPGIPPGLREKLFDPFFSGREAGRGLGFGLSKAWRIIREHAGRIDVLSGGHAFEDGAQDAQGADDGLAKGAIFRVVLPRTRR